MAEHFDTDTLADHAEGVLDPDRDARVRGHLSSCAQCRDVVDQLAGVTTMLSSLPAPAMPDDVSARIEASIAHLQHERAGYVHGAQQGTGRRAGRSWFTNLFAGRPQLLAGAAVLVVGLIFTGGYLATELNSNDKPPSTTQTGLPTTRAAVPMTTGRTYESGTLASQARGLVADRHDAHYTPNPASKPLDNELRRLQDRNVLAGCVGAVTGNHPERIVAVDLAEFNGQPAAVVVMTTPAADDKYEVAVVSPGCTANDARILTKTTIAKR